MGLAKVSKAIVSELRLLRKYFPNETASREEKVQQTANKSKRTQKNPISNDIIELKHNEQQNVYKWRISRKKSELAAKQKVLESPLTSFHLSENIDARLFDLSANIGETVILYKNTENVILQEIE